MADQYILPSEFAALLAFWFVPPLLIAWVLELYLLLRLGTWKGRRKCIAIVMVATLIVSVVGAVAVLAWSPSFFPRWLGVIDVSVAGRLLPFLPLSFVSVALSAAVFSWWGVRCANRSV